MIQVPVHIEKPPPYEYVVSATVPMLQDGLTLQLDDYPSDSRVIAHARGGWTIYDVCALAGAGDASFIAHPGMSSPAGALSSLWRFARTPGVVSIELADDAGAQAFTLTGAPIAGWHRQGNVYRTSYHHLALGRFGWAHLWVSARAGTKQLDFILELHNGIPGPDRPLTSVRVVSAYPMAPALPDPACQPPYLLKPGRYTMPQQSGRPWRFSVGLTHEPERVGVADWSKGGFLPAAWPVPAIQYDHGPDLAAARLRLSLLQPDPTWGAQPPSPLWPCSGVTQGDEGGGQDRLPLLGARWAGSRDDGLELYQIEQLRTQARARRRWGTNGAPIGVPIGVPTWSFYDGFLAGRDAPWEWDRWPTARFPFAPTGIASLVRELNDNLALAWLANDPLARLYVLETATRAVLTFPTLDQEPFSLGTKYGGALAQAMLAVAAARCLGATEHEGWVTMVVGHLRRTQMPSGVFEAHAADQYPGKNPPFDGHYMLASGGGQADFMLALWELGGADDLIRKAARGMLDLLTDWDDPGYYYFAPVGPAGSSARYLTDDDWPAGLHDAMGVNGTSGYYSSWAMGYACAAAESARAVEAFALRNRFLFGDDPRAWGVEAPSAQSNVPFENFYGVIR